MKETIRPENFVEKVQAALDITELEENQYPESCGALRYWAADCADRDVELQDMLDCVNELLNCESAFQLHPAIAELVEGILLYGMEQKDGEAANTLGALYYDGRIGTQDYKIAAELYEHAAKLGNEHARENLGYIWYYGRTGKKDYEKAFHCFLKGALSKRPISMYKIGDMYRNGYYVEKDPKMAFTVYDNCQSLMNTDENVSTAGADVSMRIADCFFEGIGVEKNYAVALMFYQQAERFFYDRIAGGDHLFQSSLKHVIINEQICRQNMISSLPDFDWIENK